ncbi:MAG: alpha-L-rhamnosidase [Duncaniella sp.]|nr:alpha-L-rhamnosidase [Muribaculum sp.]MCM1255222.1 alpha-L-rhamnosidase [Duncaniella sp.]
MRKSQILITLVLISLTANISSPAVRDKLVRDYLTPQRIIWTETDSIIYDAEALLVEGDGQATLAKARLCKIENKTRSSIILDFGRELHGGIQIFTGTGSQISTRLRVRFGESVGETCSETVENSSGEHGFSTNDHSQRDILTSVSRYGFKEIGNTGFRFVRIDVLEPSARISLKEIRAVARYRDLHYVGSFHCSDPRLDSIWKTAAYTVHLNMQEFLWDGIKRDRCIWLGDMHPEVQTIMAVFDDREVVENSLDKAVEQYPLPSWLNGMSSYSLWYLIIQHDWYMRHGNLGFLTRHKDYITGLVHQITERIDAYGNEEMNPGMAGNMTRFLDWPSTPNRQGVEAGYRALMSWALSSAENLCGYLNEPTVAKEAQRARQRLDSNHHNPNGLLQAGALMAKAGTIQPDEASSMILSKKAYGLTTFYGYYMLEALTMTGNYQEGLDIIRSYWGAMLDLGATTFWEDFNMEWLNNAGRIDEMTPPGKIDIHGAYGDYCYNGYRHSLCHGWSSGPCPWLTQHILGVKIMEPGCQKVSISPNLCDLDFAEGTFPTPYGPIFIRHKRNSDGTIESDIKLPKGVELVK